jgi:hypothetical protein
MATGLRFKLGGDKIGDTIRLRYQQQQLRIADAARHAMNEARDRIITAGREDIKRGGKFGARWTTGLQGTVEPQGVRTSNLTLSISQAVPYWRVFEYSARIFGKPLLWIPLPWNPIKVRAREFPGRLFRVNRKGKEPVADATPRQECHRALRWREVGVPQAAFPSSHNHRACLETDACAVP